LRLKRHSIIPLGVIALVAVGTTAVEANPADHRPIASRQVASPPVMAARHTAPSPVLDPAMPPVDPTYPVADPAIPSVDPTTAAVRPAPTPPVRPAVSPRVTVSTTPRRTIRCLRPFRHVGRPRLTWARRVPSPFSPRRVLPMSLARASSEMWGPAHNRCCDRGGVPGGDGCDLHC
jgi:hypothetical protein